MLDSVKDALDVQVRTQRPYELFNGRLAMLGFAFAVVGEAVTKQGPLEQLNLETGVPVIDEELFGAFFLLGVVFNVVATGANPILSGLIVSCMPSRSLFHFSSKSGLWSPGTVKKNRRSSGYALLIKSRSSTLSSSCFAS